MYVVGWMSALVFAGCNAALENSLRYSGVYSMNANISASEAFSTYRTDYPAIYNLGARGAQTAAPWSALNSTGTTYSLTLITHPDFGLSALQGYGFTTIFLNIPVVAITNRRMPADIASLAFNDAAVKARLRLMIDQVLPYLNSSVKYVAFGNEVDSYFATKLSEWDAYIELIKDARSYLKSLRSDILVGVTTTFDGAHGSQAAQVKSLNSEMDIVPLTYYPIDSNTFVPREASTVSGDFAIMKNISLGKPLILQEWGYPSSTVLASSEQKQADFFTESFNVFNRQSSTVLPLVSIFKYRDWNQAHCTTQTTQAPGGKFYEFLCSLGVLRNNREAKTAYSAILQQLQR